MPCRTNVFYGFQLSTTALTDPGWMIDGLGKFKCSYEQWTSCVESNTFSFSFGGWMTKAVVTDGSKSSWKNVLKVAFYKLSARDGFYVLDISVGSIFPAKRDLGI